MSDSRRLRWVMDGKGIWDLDLSTPSTLNGVARPVPGDPLPFLGLSRGTRLSRPKQVDFIHRFMFTPLLPSFSPSQGGLILHRLLSAPFALDHWFGTLLAQFNLHKFVSSIRANGFMQPSDSSSWFRSLGRHLSDKSLYSLDLSTEFYLTPDDTLNLSFESYGDQSKASSSSPRKKAILHHKFQHHNLTLEAASPALFVDKDGSYWDVPFLMALDLASLSSDTAGPSYHVCVNQTQGSPKQFAGEPADGVPASLLPGLSATTAISYKKNVDFWRSGAPMLKMVQPYDAFLSTPHISASGILGAVVTACLGDNSARAEAAHDSVGFKSFSLRAKGANSGILGDLFGTLSISAQHGNFQRFFLDLTRFNARLDFPSGSTFLSAGARLAKDLYNSQELTLEAVQAICPNTTLSLQQQIAGPVSFRVDSGVAVDIKNKNLSVKDPVFAIEYALQVLGSAKATAWYSPKQKEFMIELRFFET